MHVKVHRTADIAVKARVKQSQVKPLSVRLHGHRATFNSMSTSLSPRLGGVYIVVLWQTQCFLTVVILACVQLHTHTEQLFLVKTQTFLCSTRLYQAVCV